MAEWGRRGGWAPSGPVGIPQGAPVEHLGADVAHLAEGYGVAQAEEDPRRHAFKKRTISLEEGYIVADMMKGGYLTYD